MKLYTHILFIVFTSTILYNCAISKQIEIGIYGVLYDDDAKMGSVILPYNDPLKYSPYNLFDKNKNTAIALNTKNIAYENPIKHNYFIIFFKQIIILDKILFLNGYQKSDILYDENERIKTLNISFYDSDFQFIKVLSNINISDIKNNQEILFPEKISANLLLFEVTEYYSGTKYQDVCISEMELWDGNEKYEIGNLEQAKKEYLKKLKDTYKKYIAHINFKDIETVGFLEDKDTIFSKWEKCGIKTDKIVDLGTFYDNTGFNTYLSFNVDIDYSGKINIKLYGGKIMQIGYWKIDEKGAIWIRIGKGEWKVAENVHLAGTDLGTIKHFTEP